jgi:hypothetical protein
METQYVENGDAWFAFDTNKKKPLVLDDIQKPQMDS